MTQVQRAAAAQTGGAGRSRSQVVDGGATVRVLRRLAHEVAEGHPDDLDRVIIAGIRAGGIAVARGLCIHLREISRREVPLVGVDVSGFRDDRPRRARLDGSWLPLDATTGRQQASPAPSPEGSVVILVDDVIQTGRTMRAAFDVVASWGRPAAIEMAVLVDRGGREVPVRPTYVGKNLPVAATDWVEIDVAPHADAGGIFLVPRR